MLVESLLCVRTGRMSAGRRMLPVAGECVGVVEYSETSLI